MRKAALACFLILIPCSLHAQHKKDDWKALYSLHSGEKIELAENGMKKHVGTLSTVAEEAIQLREGSDDIGIPKENVVRVTVLDKSHRGRNALILGAVGARFTKEPLQVTVVAESRTALTFQRVLLFTLQSRFLETVPGSQRGIQFPLPCGLSSE